METDISTITTPSVGISMHNLETFNYMLKLTAQTTYLAQHPCANRAVRRAMHIKLAPIYGFIKDIATKNNWDNLYAGNYAEQERASLISGAMAEDTAKSLSPLDPSSAYQAVMNYYAGNLGNV